MGERASVAVVDSCPEALADRIRATAATRWWVRGEFDGSVGFHATIGFLWTADPVRPGRGALFPEVRTRTRGTNVHPRYPGADESGYGEDARCVSVVRVSPDGRGEVEGVHGCPGSFHARTVEAVEQWTWWPAAEAGALASDEVLVIVNYVLRE